ncbi:hypothetical protein Pedsa_3074 [Pseudopedobacter saltans DSM 12145]|uniref:Protochlamydia outer membrane protein domain-containing protein n=1 Tax=Pseudopedobacter saltans (strain ATCC 51119 / DSM 12145 / JCM 21818 / CCUG 39354 / LMG 10337 / NBRC 100064 / NCIMB 13643) TaxID=762903 RepID=F0SA49_PSESL|nr:hypothetical protein [Pseudopedobacter saltans]ADY53613.1 hypothetical protein Pedsa_3074 [Pseudopedobacter saltans DSM 12145]
MKKAFKAVFLSLVFTLYFSGSEAQEVAKFSVKVSEGLHLQDLDWSIAGNLNGNSPNIYSELIWEKMKGNSTEIQVGYRFLKNLTYKINAEKTFVLSGNVSDRDYSEDDRQNEIFSAVLETNKGYSWGLENSLAYSFYATKKLALLAELGYTISRQSLYLTDDGFSVGQETLNSNYKTKWQGAVLALEGIYFTDKKLSIAAIANFQKLDYSAIGNWNLVEEFAHPKSFTHRANALGYGFSIGPKYQLSKKLSLEMEYNFQKYVSKKGIDRLFFTSGTQTTTRLNGVNGLSNKIALGICFYL